MSCTAFAQWVPQTITLQPGWNAVFLEVHPEPNNCDVMFSGLPVESVWAWNRAFRPQQFVRDPGELGAAPPEWLVYYPSNHVHAVLRNLHTLNGGTPYLIKLADGSGPVAWTVTGTPRVRPAAWYPDTFNLVGMYVSDENPPTIQEYFAPSPAHAGQPVYTLNSAGQWEQITAIHTTRVQRGRAYWVRCNGVSSYAGPLSVYLDGAAAVEFGNGSPEIAVRIRHAGPGPRTCSIVSRASAAPPAGYGGPVLAGMVPLSYWEADFARRAFQWKPVPASLNYTVLPGTDCVVRLSVRRPDMQPYPGPMPAAGIAYAHVLEVSDGRGNRALVAVHASPLPQRSAQNNRALPRDGLWVGRALLDKVSQAHVSTNPVTTPAPLAFRLIVHQDTNGVVRLLQQATLVLKRAATTNYVLITNPALIPQYMTGTLDDDTVYGHRFSSAVFGFRTPQTLAYNTQRGQMTCSIMIGYDDPLNPFKHLYHPDHSNLDNYRTKLPEGVHAYDVTRALTMELTTNRIAEASAAGWGDTVVGGNYREALTGLYHDPLYVAGRFMLQFVSPISLLNDGQ